MATSLWVRLLSFSAVAGLMIFVTWQSGFRLIERDYENRLQQGADRAWELAGFFERDTLRILAIAEVHVRESLRVYKEGGIDAVRAFASDSAPGRTVVSHITVLDAAGLPVFTFDPNDTMTPSSPGNDYFLQLKEAKSDASFLSVPYAARGEAGHTVRFARRMDNPDGSFGGVIFAAIEAGEFTAFYDTLNLGPRSSATLVGTSDKRIRARSTYGAQGPGQDISGSRLWTELAQADAGLYQQESVVDGVTRYYAYRKLANYPLLVAIGLAEEDILRNASAFARPVHAIAGLTTVVILALTVMLCRDVISRFRLESEIAERRVTEAELARANTDLLQYAHSASHDLKAPLSSIWGLLDFCLEDLDSGDHGEVRRNLKEARAISKRSARKVENLLRIARAGVQADEIETFSPEELIRDIWQDLTASRNDIASLELNFSEVGDISGDRSTHQLILENLISNAIQYRDERKPAPTVRIEGRRHDGLLRITVSDNGVGIAPEHQGKVFDSFVRLDERGGDGLGLALVHKHIERLGGTITFRSKVGEGTTFTLELPERGDAHENSRSHDRRQRGRPLHPKTQAVAPG